MGWTGADLITFGGIADDPEVDSRATFVAAHALPDSRQVRRIVGEDATMGDAETQALGLPALGAVHVGYRADGGARFPATALADHPDELSAIREGHRVLEGSAGEYRTWAPTAPGPIATMVGEERLRRNGQEYDAGVLAQQPEAFWRARLWTRRTNGDPRRIISSFIEFARRGLIDPIDLKLVVAELAQTTTPRERMVAYGEVLVAHAAAARRVTRQNIAYFDQLATDAGLDATIERRSLLSALVRQRGIEISDDIWFMADDLRAVIASDSDAAAHIARRHPPFLSPSNWAEYLTSIGAVAALRDGRLDVDDWLHTELDRLIADNRDDDGHGLVQLIEQLIAARASGAIRFAVRTTMEHVDTKRIHPGLYDILLEAGMAPPPQRRVER